MKALVGTLHLLQILCILMLKLKNPIADPWFHASGAVRTGEVLGLGWEWGGKNLEATAAAADCSARQCSVPGVAVTVWRYCDLAPPTLPRVELQTKVKRRSAKFYNHGEGPY